MKKLILVTLGIVLMVHSYGIETSETINIRLQTIELTQTAQDPVVVEVKLADLPEAVKKTVAEYQTKGWEASETAYHVTNKKTKSEHYEVALKSKSGKKFTIKINKEGKELK